MIMPLASPQPSRATAKDVPRDAQWVARQGFSALEYTAIDSCAGAVRLLKVKKGRFRSDIVECELIATRLGRGKKFVALSYSCGTADSREIMLCNGKRYCITPSLNIALKAFRESKYQENFLWSDAVSINQADKEELSEQIPLMRRVYSEADSVSVYLGDTERQFSRGQDLMHRLYSLQLHIRDPEVGIISLDDVPLPSNKHPCWMRYFRLYAAPCFTRTWTL